MLDPEFLRPLRQASSDYQETEAIKHDFATLRSARSPFWLGEPEMERVFRWKLAQQYGRGAHHRALNTDAIYRAVTRAAFEVGSDDWRWEAELRVNLLCCLGGVGVPVASAVLALAEPERYCVIDFRGWRAAFGERRDSFDVPQYLTYLELVRSLSRTLEWPVQETDLAMWVYDIQKHG